MYSRGLSVVGGWRRWAHAMGGVGEGAEEPGRSERVPIASGGGMRRSEEARVSEEAVRRKGGEGGPRKLGMG